MKTTFNVTAFLLLDFSGGSVMAGSIRCQGEIIQEAQMKPLTKAQVRDKSGKPAVEDFRMLTYKTEANVTKGLRFNDAGELESITEQVGG